MPLFDISELTRIINGASDTLKAALRAALNITQISERDALRGSNPENTGVLWSSAQVRLNVLGAYVKEISNDPELDTINIRYATIDYNQSDYDADNLEFSQMMFNNATLTSATKLKIGYSDNGKTADLLDLLGADSKIELWDIETPNGYEEPNLVFQSDITAVVRTIRPALSGISTIELTISTSPNLAVGLGPNTEYIVAVSGKFKDRIVPPITDSDRGKVLGVKGDANETEFVNLPTPAPSGETVLFAARAEQIFFGALSNVGTTEVDANLRASSPIGVRFPLAGGDPNMIAPVNNDANAITILKAGVYYVHLDGTGAAAGSGNSRRVLPRIRFYSGANLFAEVDDHYHRQGSGAAFNLSGDGVLYVTADNTTLTMQIANEIDSGGVPFNVNANWSLTFSPFGVKGEDGRTPRFSVYTDGDRRVLQLEGYTDSDGTFTAQATATYVGASGYTTNVAQAVNIRGPAGAGGNLTQITDRDALIGSSTSPHSWSSKQVRSNVKGTFTQEVSDNPELDTLHIRYAAIDYDQTAYNTGNLAFAQMMFNNATLASANKIKIGYIRDRRIEDQLALLGAGSKVQLWNVNTGPDYEEPNKVFDANITAVARLERTGLDEISVIELSLDTNPSLSVGLGANTEYFVAISGRFKDRVVPPITDSDRGKVLAVKGDVNETEFVDPATGGLNAQAVQAIADAKVTDTDIDTADPSNESTSVAPSRQVVAEEIKRVEDSIPEGGVTTEENRFERLSAGTAATSNIRFIVAGQGGRPALDQFPQRDGTSWLIDYRQAGSKLIVFEAATPNANFEINLQDLIAIRTQLIGTDLDGSTFLFANKSNRTGVFTANPAIAEVFPAAGVTLAPNTLALLTLNSVGANGPSQTYELIVQPLGGQVGEDDREPLFGTAVPAGSLGVVGDAYLRTTNGQWYKKTASATWTAQVDVATQAELDAVQALIPVQHFGATVPASSLGKVGEVYFRSSTPAEIYQKTGASTWTLRLTLAAGLPTSPASGSRLGKLLQFDSDDETPVWDDRPYRSSEMTKLSSNTSDESVAVARTSEFPLSESFRNFRWLVVILVGIPPTFIYVPDIPSSISTYPLFIDYGENAIRRGLRLQTTTTNTRLDVRAVQNSQSVRAFYGIR